MKKQFFGRWTLFLVVALALVIVIDIAAARLDLRADLTQYKLHTITDETRTILEGLQDIVTIQYYVSEQLPANFHTLPRDTIERFRDYQRIAGDKIRIEIIDPDLLISEHIAKKDAEKKAAGDKGEAEPEDFNPFTGQGKVSARDEKESELEQMGVPRLQGQIVKDDRLEFIQFYSAIVIKYLDKQPESIPQHVSLGDLEYEIANRIVKLTTKDKPKFAFLLGKPDDVEEVPNQFAPGLPPTKRHPYDPILGAFEEKFEVVQIQLTEESRIPDGVQLLVLAEPDALNDRQLYELDRFLGGGGSLLLLASRSSGRIASGEGDMGITPINPRLEKLLEKWGVRLGHEIVCSEINGRIEQTRQPAGLPFAVRQQVPVPVIPAAPAPMLSQDSPLTRGLQALVFPFASPLHSDAAKIQDAGLRLTVLAKSDERTWLRPWGPQLNREMIDPPADGAGAPLYSGSVDLAYYLEGVFPAAFPEGANVPEWPAKPDDKKEDAGSNGGSAESPKSSAEPGGDSTSEPEKVPAMERKPGRVILCASVDMLKYDYLKNQGEYQLNIQFMLNAVESIALGQGLVNIRGKTATARPLAELSTTEKGVIKFGALLGTPLLLIAFGLLRYFVRHKRADLYEKMYIARTRSEGAES